MMSVASAKANFSIFFETFSLYFVTGRKGGHNYISIGDNTDVEVGTQDVFKTMEFTSKFSVK